MECAYLLWSSRVWSCWNDENGDAEAVQVSVDQLYIHLTISLDANGIPVLEHYFSRDSDGLLPVGDGELLENGIAFWSDPMYWVKDVPSQLPEEVEMLLECLKKDPYVTILPMFDQRYGTVQFKPEPLLPQNWERKVYDGGSSFFYNRRTCRTSLTPPLTSATGLCFGFQTLSPQCILPTGTN